MDERSKDLQHISSLIDNFETESDKRDEVSVYSDKTKRDGITDIWNTKISTNNEMSEKANLIHEAVIPIGV